MAKRFDNDFDADAFVEIFRAKEAPPSSPRNNTEETLPTAQEPPSSVQSNHKGSSASKPRNSALTAQAEEYRRRFIDDLTYLCPPSGCSNQLLCGNRKANLTTIINNLLRQHSTNARKQSSSSLKNMTSPLSKSQLNSASTSLMLMIPQEEWQSLHEKLDRLIKIVENNQTGSPGKDWFESDQVREILGTSPKTRQNYRDQRLIPFSQIGRKICVSRADLDAFLRQHRISQRK